MAWGDPLKRGDRGADVVELQMRLAGFRGGVPDGDYGPGTELQVADFQRDVMGAVSPSGQADAATLAAIGAFAARHPVDFGQLRCKCGVCGGFGRALNRGLYAGAVKTEAYHRYEYPGIHRMLLWAYRAAVFYSEPKGWRLAISSGYRCSEDNRRHGRATTNHMGKAIDIDIQAPPAGKSEDMRRCNDLRRVLVETAKYLADRYFVKSSAELDAPPAAA